MDNFSITLDHAIKRCEKRINVNDTKTGSFGEIYPFTTENIAGYINLFDLKDKSLLTVGSSCDQIINAVLKDCKDVTLVDINPYSKFYFYLKMASFLELERKEFLQFFRFKDYPKVFKENNNVFNKKTYKKIEKTLRLLDYESFLFWSELFDNFSSYDIRNYLFSHDEGRNSEIIGSNLYLQNNLLYKDTRMKLQKVRPKFITEDIFLVKFDRTFDNIWLSNISHYIMTYIFKILIIRMSKYLNENGNLLMTYLYETTKDTKYQKEWNEIYNLEETYELLKEYHPILESFQGVKGLKFNEDIKDSVLIYNKK